MLISCFLIQWRTETLLRRQWMGRLVPPWRESSWWHFPEGRPFIEILKSFLGINWLEYWTSSFLELENDEEKKPIRYKNNNNGWQIPPLWSIYWDTKSALDYIFAFQFWLTRKHGIKLHAQEIILVGTLQISRNVTPSNNLHNNHLILP